MSAEEARSIVAGVAAVAGLMVGSFLNVVVYRAPRQLSVVRPRSFCPRCATPIRSADNVPVVSWLVLGGRCRSCGALISPRYPLVEAGTGVLFVLVALAVGPHPAVVGLCVLGATLAACLAIEVDGGRLPLGVPAIGDVLGLACLIGAAGADRHWAHSVGALVGTVGAGAMVWMFGLRAAGEDTARASWAWAIVPAGTVVGWSEPSGAAAGGGVLVVALVVLALRRLITTRSRAAPGPVSAPALLGPAAVALVAAVVAVATAVATGTGLS